MNKQEDAWNALPVARDAYGRCDCRQTEDGYCLPGCASLRPRPHYICQRCRTYSEHHLCQRENGLGTSPCRCGCSESLKGQKAWRAAGRA